MQQKDNFESFDQEERIAEFVSSRSIMGVRQASTQRARGHNQGSLWENNLLNKKGKAVLDTISENNVSKKEDDLHRLGYNNSSCKILGTETDRLNMKRDKPFMADSCDPDSKSLSRNLKVLKNELAPEVQPFLEEYRSCPKVIDPTKSNHRKSMFTEVSGSKDNIAEGVDPTKSNHQKSILAEVSGNQDNIAEKYSAPINPASNLKCVENGQAGIALNLVESNQGDRKTDSLMSLPPCRQCSDDSFSSEFQGRDEFGLAIVSQPYARDKDEIWQVSPKDKSPIIWYPSDCGTPSPTEKYSNEYVNSGHEDNSICSSKRREGSHESVESSSSKRLFSRRKRAECPELKLTEASSSKRHKCEKPGSGFPSMKGSSFVNWISSLTSGSMMIDQARPLTSIPYKSPRSESRLRSLPTSHEKSEDSDISCKAMGFRSIFEAICLPSFTNTSTSRRDLDIQREVDASGGREFAREQIQCSLHMVCETNEHSSQGVIPRTSVRVSSVSKGNVSDERLPLFCDGDSGNLQNGISMSNQRLEYNTCHLEDLPLAGVNTFLKNSGFGEEQKYSSGKECHPYKGSPSSKGNVAITHSDNKESSIPISNPITRNGFLENLWIKRLFLEGSSSSENKTQRNQGTEAASKGVTDKCQLLHTNDVYFDREPSTSCHLLEGQENWTSDETRNSLISNPYGARSSCEHQVKSRLDPILPSRKFKKSDQMTSMFAKRLDAIKHIRPVIASDNATCSTKTCFFCGKRGHTIGKCAELSKTNLKDLLKSINPFDDEAEPSCLCILCFQLNHWAISCPNSSSKRKHITDNDFVSYDKYKAGHKLSTMSLSNCVERKTVSSGGKKVGQHVSDDWRNDLGGDANAESELLAKLDVSISAAPVVSHEHNNLTMNQEKDIGECSLQVKLISSGSGEKESKGKQIIPYNNVARVAEDSCGEYFETIRRLRLSRSDIIRWTNLSVPKFSLEGFFVRIRCGKDEGCKENGYRAACIISVDYRKRISVRVGNSTSLVDFRSVSNQDFSKEELEAWWYSYRESGVNTPSQEDLNKKLQVRLQFGL